MKPVPHELLQLVKQTAPPEALSGVGFFREPSLYSHLYTL